MVDIDYSKYLKHFNKLGKNKENIVVINNFISDEDLITINEYLNKYKDDDEFMGGKDLREQQVKEEATEVYELLVKYEQKIYDEAYNHFTVKNGIPIKRVAINETHFVKWVPGMDSKLHADCEKPDGTPALGANFFAYNVSVLMYPNDSYVGGEIAFPDYDVVIKPKPGDMVMFPGNSSYRHTVQLLEEGIRYTMPSWYTFDVDTEYSTAPHTYEDSVQLWPFREGNEPVGDKTREAYLSAKSKMEG